MPAQKKGTSQRTKTNTPGSRSGSGERRQPKQGVSRRSVLQIYALITLILGVILLLGVFRVEGWLVNGLGVFTRWLVGAGAYVLPVSLLAVSALLFLRPRRVRPLFCAALFALPVLVGCFGHLIAAASTVYSPFFMDGFKTLATEGAEIKSGGLISGGVAILLKFGLSIYGAYILLAILSVAAMFVIFNISVNDAFDFLRRVFSRVFARRDYIDDLGDEDDDADSSGPPDVPAHIPRAKRLKDVVPDTGRRPFRADIPMDDNTSPPPAGKPKGLFAPRPSPVLRRDAAQPAISPDEDDDELSSDPSVLESPIDIPFDPEPVEYAPSAGVPRAISGETPYLDEMDMPDQAADEGSGADDDFERPRYVYPPMSLLNYVPDPAGDELSAEEIRQSAARLLEALGSFGIEAKIIDVTRGPSVTRYEVQLRKGIKYAKLTGLSNDIALALGSAAVRISPLPDKIAVGIEVPNKHVKIVCLREVLESPEFAASKSRVAFALGKDISGQPVVGDIAKMPHLLIAGTTGSGKSVCMNSLLISLLYKSSPEELRLIMIDPKMIELGDYNGIPHLLIPVVTDPHKAAGALQWAVGEMMRRYKLLSEVGVRDIFAYNRLTAEAADREAMPQIVIVIDELADLMLVAPGEVEEAICRIAQMARAAGMHLVIATQRPSADVITGIMKANIPSRVAFAVSSQINSRIILDAAGAEKLIGRGDMLYHPIGASKPVRVQGCMASTEEIESVIGFIKSESETRYSQEVIQQIEENARQQKAGGSGRGDESEPDDEGDVMLPDAVEVVLESGLASTSLLQRRLKLGYSRAARIIDEMEERGIVGPFEGSKPRQVLISRADWQEMNMRRSENDAFMRDFE